MADDEGIISSTSEEVRVITQNILEVLLNKWHSMYALNEELKRQRLNQFVCHLKDFYHEMSASVENRKNVYAQEVESKLKECKDLEKALNVSISLNIDCTETPLTEVIKHLDESLKSFEQLKLQRMAKFECLRKKESALCRVLGFTELNISSIIPSEEDINKLEHRIFILEEEKINRTEQFHTCREKILEYMQKLEVSTLLDFEKTLADSDAAYSLTAEDMDRVKDIEAAYHNQYETTKIKVDYMFNELNKLWEKIDVDEEERRIFMEENTGVGRKTVEHIEKEIQRCQVLKAEMIEPIIKKTINQILDLCDKLCYSDEQKAQYLAYNKNHFSEDLLDILEIEYGKLEFIYNENSNILEAALNHVDLWNRMLELEEAAKDKNRLFNNRGGQLLREEKDRKTIEQTLPKLHKRLEELLLDYQERMNKPFLFYGENLLEKIRSDLEMRNANKQNKPVKKNEGSRLIESAKKLREKRKCNVMLTPSSSDCGKRLRLASSTTSLASSASKSNKSIGGSRSRVDQDRSCSSSYSIFQEGIEEKKKSATMCNPERQPLKDVNSPVYQFHSSPSHDIQPPRFNFRPRANQFNASSVKKNTSTNKSTVPTPTIKNTPKQANKTPVSRIKLFATPKTITKSAPRIPTPRSVTPSLRTAATPRTYTTNFFSTTPRSNQKTLSIIKPAKLKFEF